MGIPPLPQLFSFDSDGNHSNEQITGKLLKVQAERRMKDENQKIMPKKKVRQVRCRRPRTRSVLMKRRARHEGWRRAMNPMEKKVKTLKKLIPNSESRGLDGLFRETAEYILSLQMRVRVMQIMVKVLTGCNDE